MAWQDELTTITGVARRELDAVDAAREAAYRLQREVTRAAASTIRAAHRGELAEADRLLAECLALTATMNRESRDRGSVYFAGFVMDAQKECAEAALVVAILGQGALPDPTSLGVDAAPWLNGLAEAAGELRRATLNALQQDDHQTAARLVEVMDAIYAELQACDYPDAVSYGLKRRLDMVRGVLERTQSDLFHSARESRLQAAMARLEHRLATP